MSYCTSCGQPQQSGAHICLSCGNQLPGQQLMARLNAEAEQIRRAVATLNGANVQNGQTMMHGNGNTEQSVSTLQRLEEMRRQADAAARRRQAEQQGQHLRW